MNASGKTRSEAPSPAASAASRPSLSIVASRSRTTGSACTQATFTGASTPPIVGLQHAHGERAGGVARLRRAEHEPAALRRSNPEGDLAGSVRVAGLPLDPGAGDSDRRARDGLHRRIRDGDDETCPMTAEGGSVDRYPQPLGDVDPLRLRPVAPVHR